MKGKGAEMSMTIYIIENNFIARGMANTALWLYTDINEAKEDFSRFRRNWLTDHKEELAEGKIQITADWENLFRVNNCKGEKLYHDEYYLTDRTI